MFKNKAALLHALAPSAYSAAGRAALTRDKMPETEISLQRHQRITTTKFGTNESEVVQIPRVNTKPRSKNCW